MKSALSVAIAVVVVACSGPAFDDSDFPQDICATPVLEGLTLTAPADGIVLRGEDGEIARFGAPCESATDRAACERTIAEKPADGFSIARGPGELPDHHVLIVTRGDLIAIARDATGLMEQLGTVDTAAEARLVALLRGHRPACRWRSTAGGIELYATESRACGRRYALVVRVTSDGELQIADTDEIDPGAEGCTG